MAAEGRSVPTLVVEPSKGWLSLNLGELWEYRELLWFLGIRDVIVRYKQTALGPLWAIVQPLSTVLVFTVFFGRVARIPSEGLPYPVFSMAGLVAWNFFAGSLTRSAGGLLSQASLISKVYFPRLVVPLSSLVVSLVDGALGLLVLFGLMAAYSVPVQSGLVALPLVLLFSATCALGFGLWVSALTVRYRDLHHLLGFMVQLWMYATPVIYPTSVVTHRLEALGLPGWVYGLNPMAGAVTAARALLIGNAPFPWALVGVSAATAAVVLVGGALFFRRTERTFVDVI